MSKPLVSDELWAMIAPLLPPEPPKPRGGRPRVSDRAALTGIIFVLRSGIPWNLLPKELGCGSAMTCWRRLHTWQQAGIWEQVWRRLLAHLQAADGIDWQRAVLDSASVRAVLGGAQTGPNPTDRARLGSKHHLISDAQGIPLAVSLTAANVPDVTQLHLLVETIPPLPGKRGRPRRRPKIVQGDRGYDSTAHRQWLRLRHIVAQLARRFTPHGSGLGKTRWVVERTLAWLHQYRRLRIRWERRDDIHYAFLTIGCILVCWNFLKDGF